MSDYTVILNRPAYITDSTGSILSVALSSLTASYALTASYVAGAATTWDAVTEKPVGLVSSSVQINTGSFTGSFVGDGSGLSGVVASGVGIEVADDGVTRGVAERISFDANLTASVANGTASIGVSLPQGVVSASSQATGWTVATASYALNAVTELPAGLVSSSAQVDYTQIQNQPTSIPTASFVGNALVTASASATTITFTKANGTTFDVTVSQSGSVESASYASVAQTVLNAPATASYAVTASAATSITFTPTSASYADTASFVGNAIVTASVAATTITFEKGDGSTFNVEIAQSGSVESASYASTAGTSVSSSFATTASYALNSVSELPSGLVSSSVQITLQETTGQLSASRLDGSVPSASYAETAVSASYFTGNIEFSNGLDVTGSVVSTGGFTGSLQGTSSFAVTASYALNAVGGESASFATTASYAQAAATASYFSGSIGFPDGLTVTGSVTASQGFFGTASQAVTSSYAVSASYALNGGGGGVSSSFATTASYAQAAATASYFSGSVLFENGLIVTGSLEVTGGITGSFGGTIESASTAQTASVALTLPQVSVTTPPIVVSPAYQVVTSGSQHLSDGTYAVACVVNTPELTNYRLSGLLSWTQTVASTTVQDEVPVHRSGYTTASVFLRTFAVSGSLPELQLGSDTILSSSVYTLTFTRLV